MCVPYHQRLLAWVINFVLRLSAAIRVPRLNHGAITTASLGFRRVAQAERIRSIVVLVVVLTD